jgi:hypothetical protein
MHGPGPVGWLLVALGGGTGGYCLLRARRARPWWRQAAAVEGVMGLGMAAMAATAGLAPLLVVFFAAVTAWCVVLPGRGGAHRAHHLVEGVAMVYMALAMAADPGPHAAGGAGQAHGAAGVPWITGVLLAYFALWALRAGQRLVPVGGRCGDTASARPPEVAAACRVALSVGMLAMLLTL